MHWHTTDYRENEAPTRGHLFHRAFRLSGIPRPLIWCRLLGHKPVVDGYGPDRPGLQAARWVCCDRCGVRPDPQGRLDPGQSHLGRPYRGPHVTAGPLPAARTARLTTLSDTLARHDPPGGWPARPDWAFGGELVLGKTFGLFGIEVKVGNPGSEHTLAAHLRIGPIGALYLHTERLGTWLQRRLVPTGYDSRVISLTAEDWRVRWQLWARRNTSSRSDPWWMRGSINLDLVERVLGPKRSSYDDVGDPVTITVRMPHGDDHDVVAQLQRQTHGRTKGRKTHSWTVDWDTLPGAGGIPTKPGNRDRIYGSAVSVDDQTVGLGAWPMTAAAAIAASLTADRSRYGWRAPTTAFTES